LQLMSMIAVFQACSAARQGAPFRRDAPAAPLRFDPHRALIENTRAAFLRPRLSGRLFRWQRREFRE
jgi:hypothetical protein